MMTCEDGHNAATKDQVQHLRNEVFIRIKATKFLVSLINFYCQMDSIFFFINRRQPGDSC